ncbi:MAG: helix-hairpin-helix domain-containing protein [Comamonas sp.]
MQWGKNLVWLALCAGLSLAAAVEINTATEAELDSVNGIGPAMSSRILQERKAAAFIDWGDMMRRVSGVGQKKATQFSRQGLTVNGKSFTTTESREGAAHDAR